MIERVHIVAEPKAKGLNLGPVGEVVHERGRQLDLWGEQLHDPPMWLAILMEEVGEVAKEVAEGRVGPFDGRAYRTELVQVAAVAVAAVESYDALLAARSFGALEATV